MVLDMQEMYVGSGRDKNEYSYAVGSRLMSPRLLSM